MCRSSKCHRKQMRDKLIHGYKLTVLILTLTDTLIKLLTLYGRVGDIE